MENNKKEILNDPLGVTETMSIKSDDKRATPQARNQEKDPLIGQTIENRFFIKQRLGAGGIGVVYLAEDVKVMRRQVVIKVLLEDCYQNEDLRRKFEQEQEALARLDHPAIVNILDAGTLADCKPYFVMPYLKGRTLRDVLDIAAPLSFQLCAHILLNLTDALSAAHEQGILHRDIKPENIMLIPKDDGLDRIWLLDFGIARIFNSQVAPVTQIERGVGTALYVAPEQMRGSLNQTSAVDVYSCGILAYEMLTGERPFNPRSVYEMLLLQEKNEITPLQQIRPEIPAQAEQLIMRALSIRPEDRPQSARSFGKALASALRQNERNEKDPFEETIPSDFNITLPPAPELVVENLNAEHPNSSAQNVLPAAKRHPTLASQPNFKLDIKLRPNSKETLTGRSKLLFGAALSAVLLIAVLVIGTVYLLRPDVIENQPATVSDVPKSLPQRRLSYFLEGQKTGSAKPELLTGREIFKSGSKFTITLNSDSAGYLYLFNEGEQSVKGKIQFAPLFPTPTRNGGSARINANERIETDTNTFRGGTGTETFWLIWTARQEPALERAADSARLSGGIVEDSTVERQLREFIKNNETAKPQYSKDTNTYRTTLEGSGDLMIHRFELEHR